MSTLRITFDLTGDEAAIVAFDVGAHDHLSLTPEPPFGLRRPFNAYSVPHVVFDRVNWVPSGTHLAHNLILKGESHAAD